MVRNVGLSLGVLVVLCGLAAADGPGRVGPDAVAKVFAEVKAEDDLFRAGMDVLEKASAARAKAKAKGKAAAKKPCQPVRNVIRFLFR